MGFKLLALSINSNSKQQSAFLLKMQFGRRSLRQTQNGLKFFLMQPLWILSNKFLFKTLFKIFTAILRHSHEITEINTAILIHSYRFIRRIKCFRSNFIEFSIGNKQDSNSTLKLKVITDFNVVLIRLYCTRKPE